MASPQSTPPPERAVPALLVPDSSESLPARAFIPPPSTMISIAEAIPADLLAHRENTPVLVRLDLIDIQPGFNPRKFFNPETYPDLVESIRRHRRVFHNIVVQPQPNSPGRYWVVAGERRWRAAAEVGLEFIPALILDLTDDEALAIAVAENKDRDGISPGEEALCAQRMMHLTEGDREEAAKRLGWSPHKLDVRLQLCHATEPVLMALAASKIKLGHAELLSPLPEATQKGTLEDVIARKIPVEELRAKLDAFALDLATAYFDKAGCRGCPHNTTRQASLFEQNIGEGRCTNRPCFHQKTVEYLESQRVGLRDEYNAVFIDTERAPGSWTLLLKRNVGTYQFGEGCKQCKHFGCLLSSKPGEAGKLTTDVCFNLACHQEKVAAYQATLETAPPSESLSSAPRQDHTSEADKKPAPKRKVATAAAAPKRVQDLIHEIQRRAAAAEVERNAKMTQVYAVLALMHELGIMHSTRDSNDALNKRGVKRSGSDSRTQLIGVLYALDAAVLAAITAELAGQIAGRGATDTLHQSAQYLQGAQNTLQVLAVDLAQQHFCLDAKFLEAHTKSGIDALLTEAGFATYYNTLKKDPAAFKKLMNDKHAHIIKTVMKAGFDFKGFVPNALRVPAK